MAYILRFNTVIMQHGWNWLERPKTAVQLLGKVDMNKLVSHIL
jgi:hypothetical protein